MTMNTKAPLMPSLQRMVSKDGRVLYPVPAPSSQSGAWLRVRRDLMGAWLNLRWRWVILIFCCAFLLQWLLFATLWYVLVWNAGDLDRPEAYDPLTADLSLMPCVLNLQSFSAAFTFAVETHLTIGYGTIYPNPKCRHTVLLLTVQMLVALVFDAISIGALVAKFTRPGKRCEGLVFSQQACVCEVDGEVCVAFRVCNTTGLPLQDVCVSAVLLERDTHTHTHAVRQTELDFRVPGMGSRPCPLFLSPLTFRHPLTPTSPLAEALRSAGQSQFELVVFLSAATETGSTHQRRTSYVAAEILQGRTFATATTHRCHDNHCFQTLPWTPQPTLTTEGDQAEGESV
ncbi:inward rectifier potassium channel 13 [Sardina pilchardus]|uniref:inward rectifier potassium channel 13 n=1 Tax=Sardina pilchardus TaxID=27697 RepID=UPI002E10F89F